MTARLCGMTLPLIGWSGGKALIRGELRDTITLRLDPEGLSLDALDDTINSTVCEEIMIEPGGGDVLTLAGYTYRAMLARDATEEDCIRLIMAKPSKADELQAVVDILTGEAD